MRWQDQSESATLPAVSTYLAKLRPEEAVRMTAPDNTLPRVAISAECFQAMLEHLSGARVERGGLLVGQAFGSGGGAPEVIAADRNVESRTFDATGVSLRMETEVWEAARPLLGPDALIVGWYHSHPDLGAFFSDTDRTTQRNFFRQPYSIGIVIDPVREELKAFLGPACIEIPAENVVIHESS